MPTARYWRLNIARTSGGSRASVAELAFLDAARTDLSVGGTAFASSVYAVGREASKAFDKSTATGWASATGAPFPAHIGYDHGVAVTVEAISLRGNAGGEYPNAPSDLSLQHSDDGTTWSSPLKLRLAGGEFTTYTYATLAIWGGISHAIAVGVDLFASTPTPSQTLTRVFLRDGQQPYRDFENSGAGHIAGTVKKDADPSDLPLKRRVRLHREVDGLLIREVWSDAATGAYDFTEISMAHKYTVIAYDHLHDYRAVIADNITPEVMP